MKRVLYIDPWTPLLYRDQLFNPASPFNRDSCQQPWIDVARRFEHEGFEVHTADRLLVRSVTKEPEEALYLSIGQRQNFPLLLGQPGIRLFAYFQFEPPCVDPLAYRRAPFIGAVFDHVFANSTGIWPNARKLNYPQVHQGFLPDLDPDASRKLCCCINANKTPHPAFEDAVYPELYSERIRALDALGDAIDLYGPGWERPNHGAPADKFAVLRQYDFCLCFENQALLGYVTEKLFECLFAGAIPIYLGAPDIEQHVWPPCFVDMRQADDYDDLVRYLATWDASAKNLARAVARGYLDSPEFRPYAPGALAEQLLALV